MSKDLLLWEKDISNHGTLRAIETSSEDNSFHHFSVVG